MITVTAAPESEPSPLQRHLAATYFTMRVGLGAIAVAFPFVLSLGGWFYASLPVQDSMSAYFHAASADGRSMRTWFVGTLFALGALLTLYKGFSRRENIALNVAGIAAVGVAVFPMEWECGADCSAFSIHGASAIVAFLAIAYVAARRSGDTLDLVRDPIRRKRLKWTYRVLASVMLLSPVGAFVLTSLLALENALVFFVETFGILAFAAYWVVKSTELRETHGDYLGALGYLQERGTGATPARATT